MRTWGEAKGEEVATAEEFGWGWGMDPLCAFSAEIDEVFSSDAVSMFCGGDGIEE